MRRLGDPARAIQPLAGSPDQYSPVGAPPRTARSASGETVSGVLAYRDEFHVALKDDTGRYRAWSTNRVKYKIDAPAEAHAELLAKYTDADIHNLMAYLQTLR